MKGKIILLVMAVMIVAGFSATNVKAFGIKDSDIKTTRSEVRKAKISKRVDWKRGGRGMRHIRRN